MKVALTPARILRHRALAALFVGLLSACASTPISERTVTLSVIGTNDVHGQLLPRRTSGGLALFSGYMDALRQVRSEDGGHVLLIDAGDMWQGTLESNLSEGLAMVDAYSALGYDAAAVGNHEFDFGPVGERATPSDAGEDPRGALKAGARLARFPLLAANLIDETTDKPVDWPNVQPSVMLERSGLSIGVIGVMTIDALSATIAANVQGLRVAPLAPTIAAEARSLRRKGADLVIVTAHARGSCTDFDSPYDLSSCEPDEEIMQVARALPAGLVDHIIAGHQHRGIAHVVNGISITAAYSSTRSFGRVDFTLDASTGAVLNRVIFPPQRLCPYTHTQSNDCAWESGPEVLPARYEGREIVPNPIVSHIVSLASDMAESLKARSLGVVLDTPLTLAHRPESSLGNLFTDALLESSGADVSMHNVHGGIRANLTAGELTYGKLFQMFPFDNRVVLLHVSGQDLRNVVAAQIHRGVRRAGFSGMTAHIACTEHGAQVTLRRVDGSTIEDDDTIALAVNDFLALGGDDILTPIIPPEGFAYPSDTPLARDALIEWLKQQPGPLSASQFTGPGHRRWFMPETLPDDCR